MSRDTDHCKACGSDDLFSGFFGKDGLATDGREDGNGSKWDTCCNQCGQFQSKRVRPTPPATESGPLRVGQDVQANPTTDQWRRGMRYGRIIAFVGDEVHVILNGTKLVARFAPDDLIGL